MSTRPRIGITTYPPNRNGGYELPEPYVASVRRAGGEAFLLPPGHGDHGLDVATVLASLDGVLIAGGGDVDPSRNDGRTHETIYATHDGRDRDDLALVGAILESGTPTLAICRGSQVVNLALGGTLFPHLPDVVDGSVLHRIEPPELRAIATPTPHEVSVDPDSLIARAMAAATVTPMSWHHQAVDRLGDGLRVVARAADGTVEAVEHDTHPWLAAVQWHPELTAADDPTQQRLFDALVEASARRDR